jgi:hypothetical protein
MRLTVRRRRVAHTRRATGRGWARRRTVAMVALAFTALCVAAATADTSLGSTRSAVLKRCSKLDEGTGGFHYWVGIYPARRVTCAQARFVFRRTSKTPDRYVTVAPGHNPWLVWNDGWGCDGHSVWVCLYRFRNPIHGVTRMAFSSECGAGSGCPARLRVSIEW